MTPEKLEALWTLGQQQEAQGALDAARETYAEILAGSPRQLMVQVKLSELEQRAGRYRAGRHHALQAADTIEQTKRWEGLAFVTANLLIFDERQRVLDLIRQPAWDDPRIIRQSPVLSQQLWLCGDDEAALRLLDSAGRRAGRDHRLAYSRGMALQHLGALERATQAFEESIEIAPQFALSHWSLASHARSAVPAERVARVRAALGSQDGAFERAMLHYALYKELDDADHKDAAWTELESGAGIMRGLLNHSALSFQASIDALLSGTPVQPDGMAQAQGSHTPVFIVGMPRTGTTLLSRIVSAHAAVADGGELNALQHAIGEQLDRFVELPLPADALAALQGIDPRQVAEGYLRRTRGYYTGTTTHLIDKNPMNVFAAGLIAEAMPHAKILCMARGAMDTCYSNLRQLFQNGAFAYSYDQRQLADRYVAFRRVVDAFKARLPSNFMEVSYEELVGDPAATSSAVMEFCGLDFDPVFADITRNTSPSATASSTQIREPIHQHGIGEWRRYEEKLQPLIRRLGELGVAL